MKSSNSKQHNILFTTALTVLDLLSVGKKQDLKPYIICRGQAGAYCAIEVCSHSQAPKVVNTNHMHAIQAEDWDIQIAAVRGAAGEAQVSQRPVEPVQTAMDARSVSVSIYTAKLFHACVH